MSVYRNTTYEWYYYYPSSEKDVCNALPDVLRWLHR